MNPSTKPVSSPEVVADAPSIEAGRDCQVVSVCPACGGKENDQCGGVAAPFSELVGEREFCQPAYSIRSCRNCSLYFKSHVISYDQLDPYYDRLDCSSFEVDHQFPTDRVLQSVLAKLPSGRKILDFGCSTGRILKNHTQTHDCFGVELNETAAGIARQRGLTIIDSGGIASGVHEGFDVIILTDVYEHLVQPFELVKMLYRSLKPEGILVIVTGNADGISMKDRMAEFWYFRLIGHLQMLGEQHASWMAEQLGARIKQLHRCSHYSTSLTTRLVQRLYSFAYLKFRESPNGFFAKLLRMTPRVRNVERLNNLPPLSFADDHVVLLLEKPTFMPT